MTSSLWGQLLGPSKTLILIGKWLPFDSIGEFCSSLVLQVLLGKSPLSVRFTVSGSPIDDIIRFYKCSFHTA